MEKLVPQLMGVSPAVLESVIFCHQDDSLWPLSDAKTLKDRFDDIFAATRYTKALEAIFKLRKEKATEIKVMEADLKVIEANVETAHKVRKQSACMLPLRLCACCQLVLGRSDARLFLRACASAGGRFGVDEDGAEDEQRQVFHAGR